MLPVPRIPRPPVHHGEWLPWWRVQVLSRVWLPCPDSSDSVHQEDPALKRGALSVDLLVSSSLSPSSHSIPLSSLLCPIHNFLDSASLASLHWIPNWSQVLTGVCCLQHFFLKKHQKKGKISERQKTGMTELREKAELVPHLSMLAAEQCPFSPPPLTASSSSSPSFPSTW